MNLMDGEFSAVLVPANRSHPIREIRNSEIEALVEGDPDERLNVIRTLLVRDRPMLSVHHRPDNTASPNVRATSVAMVCGYFRMRIHGDAVFSLDRSSLRCQDLEAATSTVDIRNKPGIPSWLLNGSRSRFQDLSILERLAKAMEDKDSESENASNESDQDRGVVSIDREVVTKVPLCLACRRPTSNLCPGCFGVYFCNEHCAGVGFVHTTALYLRSTHSFRCKLAGPTNASVPIFVYTQKGAMR